MIRREKDWKIIHRMQDSTQASNGSLKEENKLNVEWEWMAPIQDSFLLDRLKASSLRFGFSKEEDASLHVALLKRFADRFDGEIDSMTFRDCFEFAKSKGIFFDELSDENKKIARGCLFRLILNRYRIINRLRFSKFENEVENLRDVMLNLFEQVDAFSCFKELQEIEKREKQISDAENDPNLVSLLVPVLPRGFDDSIFLDDRVYFCPLIGLLGSRTKQVILEVKTWISLIPKCLDSPFFSDFEWIILDPDFGLKFETIDGRRESEETSCSKAISLLERITVCLYHFTKTRSKDSTVTDRETNQVGRCYRDFVDLWVSSRKKLLAKSNARSISDIKFDKLISSSLERGSFTLLAVDFDDELIRTMFPSIGGFQDLVQMYSGKLNLLSNLKKKNQEELIPLTPSEKLLSILFDLSCLKNSSLRTFKDIYGKSWLANPAYVVPDSIKVQVKHSLHILVLRDWLKLYSCFKRTNPFQTKKFCSPCPIPARFLNDPSYFDVSKLYYGFVDRGEGILRPMDPEEIRSCVEEWKIKYLIAPDLQSCCLASQDLGRSDSKCPLLRAEEEPLSVDGNLVLSQIIYVGQFKNAPALPFRSNEVSKVTVEEEDASRVISEERSISIRDSVVPEENRESNKDLSTYPSISPSSSLQPLELILDSAPAPQVLSMSKIRPWISPYYDNEGTRVSIECFHLVRFPSTSSFDLRKEPWDHMHMGNPIDTSRYFCSDRPSDLEWNNDLWNRICKTLFWVDHVCSLDEKQLPAEELGDGLDSTVDLWWNKASSLDAKTIDSGSLWNKFRRGNLPLWQVARHSWLCFSALAENKLIFGFVLDSRIEEKRILETYDRWIQMDPRPRILSPLPCRFFSSFEDPNKSFSDHLNRCGYGLQGQPSSIKFVEGYWNQVVVNFYGIDDDTFQTKLLRMNLLSIDHLFLEVGCKDSVLDLNGSVRGLSSMTFWNRFFVWLFASGNGLRRDPSVSAFAKVGTDIEVGQDGQSCESFLLERTELLKEASSKWTSFHHFYSKTDSVPSLESFYSTSDLYLFRLSKRIKQLENKLKLSNDQQLSDKIEIAVKEKKTYESIINNLRSLEGLSKGNGFRDVVQNMGPLFLNKLDPGILRFKFLDHAFQGIEQFKPKSRVPLLDPRLLPRFSDLFRPVDQRDFDLVEKYDKKRNEWIRVHSEMLSFRDSSVYSTMRQRSESFDL